MQIAAYANEQAASSQYRVYQPMTELSRRGHVVELRHRENDFEPPAPGCEVVFMARYREAPAQPAAGRRGAQ